MRPPKHLIRSRKCKNLRKKSFFQFFLYENMMFSQFFSIYRYFALIKKNLYEFVALAAILQYNAALGLLNLVQCSPPACLSLRPLV
jgi:hypothetical protein